MTNLVSSQTRAYEAQIKIQRRRYDDDKRALVALYTNYFASLPLGLHDLTKEVSESADPGDIQQILAKAADQPGCTLSSEGGALILIKRED